MKNYIHSRKVKKQNEKYNYRMKMNITSKGEIDNEKNRSKWL